MVKTENTLGEFSLLRLAPPVLRARDFRLYTQDGGRLVDLWQAGGAAVLGHTPPSILRELKNTASRGLYAPFPHFLEGRFIKALSRVFSGKNFRLYAAPPPELEALSREGKAALWRPFLDAKNPLALPPNPPPVLVPVLPGIQGWRNNLPLGLCVLALDQGFAAQLPLGDFISPALLAVAVRGVYDLAAAAKKRANLAYPRILKALRESPWQRQGIYLFRKKPPDSETWAALFRRFLQEGFLLPPTPAQPVIIPGELSPGEEAKLAILLNAG
jgi:hypothetical protein